MRSSAKSATKKGGANKKMKKFPRIVDYLEVHHPQIYKIIEDLAMHNNLTPRRGGAVTFLLPDAAYIKEITKMIESDEPEKATDMVSSLILLDLFEKSEDFASKQDDIPNLLRKKLIIKSITPTKILIDDGELTLDTKFKPFSRQGATKRGNMAVWNLKGKVAYEKAPESAMKYVKTIKKGNTPTVQGGAESSVELRDIKNKIVDDELKAIDANKRSLDGGRYCPLMNAVTRLLRVFMSNPGYFPELRKAKSILTMCPFIDFYLLYCNPIVFPTEKVVEAYKLGIDVDNNVDTYKKFCDNYSHPAYQGENQGLILKKSDLTGLHAMRDNLRDSILGLVSRNMGAGIAKLYAELDENNTLGGNGPVYPPELAAIFRANKGLHLLIDEFSLMAHTILYEEVRLAPTCQEKASRMRSALHVLYESYGSLTNPEKKTRLDKSEIYENSIQNYVITFLKTWAVHLPCNTESDFESREKIGAGEFIDDEAVLVDIDSPMIGGLDEYDNCPGTISSNAMAELLAYKKSHGKLPDELL